MPMAMTIGKRLPAARRYASFMNERPWEEVAVNVRPPAAQAPRRTPMAEFSPSGSTISQSRRPSASNLYRVSTRGVWGVIG
jgi:hypothetical protein